MALAMQTKLDTFVILFPRVFMILIKACSPLRQASIFALLLSSTLCAI
jgi:hypothetical protein